MSLRGNAYKNRATTLPAMAEGVVVSVSDPQENGRVQVWIPGIDGENANFENLPWAKVTSPMAGQINNYPGGGRGTPSGGLMSYGWWMIPPKDSIVIVAFMFNDPNQRRVLGSSWGDHGNRSFPQGRNRPELSPYPLTDNLNPVEPQATNLKAQFNGKIDSPEAQTRGAKERQAGSDSDVRDGKRGYQKSPYPGDNSLTPQTYGFTTPGRHSLIFQDNPEDSHIRVKTANGNQMILDDTNERVYVSTARGACYLEMDDDGHFHVYSMSDFSIGSGGSINLTAAKKLHLYGKTGVTIGSGADLIMTGCGTAALSGKGLYLDSDGEVNMKASGNIIQSGANIHLNGPAAAGAPCAPGASVIPDHEPWTRPASAIARGPNWKK